MIREKSGAATAPPKYWSLLVPGWSITTIAASRGDSAGANPAKLAMYCGGELVPVPGLRDGPGLAGHRVARDLGAGAGSTGDHGPQHEVELGRGVLADDALAGLDRLLLARPVRADGRVDQARRAGAPAVRHGCEHVEHLHGRHGGRVADGHAAHVARTEVRDVLHEPRRLTRGS